jgi:hypothetical protein
LTIDLVDEIDVDNWIIDDYEKPKDFQANPPSFDVKQALILEKKQDVNVVFKSLLIEDGIMEIHLCHIISMQVVTHALMNDILKLRGDFYSCYHLGATIFYVYLEWIDGCNVDVNQERTNNWDDHWKAMNKEFEAYLQSKPSLHHLVGKMFHVWDGNH